jgi:hypothetical protein
METRAYPLGVVVLKKRATMMFFALCAGEAAIGFILLSLYRAATKPDVWSFLYSLPGIVFLCSSVIVAISVGWITQAILTSNRSWRRHHVMAIGLNLVMLFLMVATTEVMSFALSKHTAVGQTLLGVVLYPKHWARGTEQQQKALDEAARESSYYNYDPLLGWTVGRSRSNPAEQEVSSTDGLRSPSIGISFSDPRSRHAGLSSHAASVRVALVGDSMTFGSEVRCEETWGHVLEGLLQPHAQILNFGVPAFGLNQAILRYEKDVRAWHPQIVVIGISSQMISRINNIYPELMNPEWDSPLLARPKLVMKNGAPSTINYPIPTPREMFSYSTVQELPHLDLDPYYRSFQWERGGIWYIFEHSYIFRFLNSLRPPTKVQPKDIHDEDLLLSQFVTQYLVRRVLEDGAIPVIVWLPYASELPNSTDLGNVGHSLTRALRDAGIEYYDPSGCLNELGTSEAYAAGGHYSAKGNVHLAECLEPLLRARMNRPVNYRSLSDSPK